MTHFVLAPQLKQKQLVVLALLFFAVASLCSKVIGRGLYPAPFGHRTSQQTNNLSPPINNTTDVVLSPGQNQNQEYVKKPVEMAVVDESIVNMKELLPLDDWTDWVDSSNSSNLRSVPTLLLIGFQKAGTSATRGMMKKRKARVSLHGEPSYWSDDDKFALGLSNYPTPFQVNKDFLWPQFGHCYGRKTRDPSFHFLKSPALVMQPWVPRHSKHFFPDLRLPFPSGILSHVHFLDSFSVGDGLRKVQA